jgi:hypothetical protein
MFESMKKGCDAYMPNSKPKRSMATRSGDDGGDGDGDAGG